MITDEEIEKLDYDQLANVLVQRCKHEWKRGFTDPHKSKWREFRQCQKCGKVEYREFSFKHEWSR